LALARACLSMTWYQVFAQTAPALRSLRPARFTFLMQCRIHILGGRLLLTAMSVILARKGA